ncbi:MAG TPA: glycosyl hydrolase family 18 protein [Acidimicrobiales bacterium]|nr:glycosyl hydrolase family 18 protein [Acidimicrobiales bacterium]
MIALLQWRPSHARGRRSHGSPAHAPAHTHAHATHAGPHARTPLTVAARQGAILLFEKTKKSATLVALSVFFLAMLTFGFLVGVAPSGSQATGAHGGDHAARHHHGRAAAATFTDAHGNAGFRQLGASAAGLKLAPATAAPAAAPAALVAQPPLASRENFAFAPYWTLPQSGGFSITGLSTLAYFSIDVNANGTLDESGPGWTGFQSQDLANLITRAHAAGERVVLTVTDFDQGSLDAITSSSTAGGTLAATLIPLLQQKSLDGVNFDFEGEGSGDQAGLTNLVGAVSTALRAADPHWQITMDTYASSAGDSSGFYNIAALGQYVDAFFVMDYELNLQGSPSAASPLTSTEFSSLTTLQQYTSAVPASKVILGLPFFGIDWPTDNGTMAANAAGGANDIPDSQAAANGPQYWDPVTDTSWTSYQVGGQWHESYYEGEYGLYLAAQMATRYGARGVGIWALGMESDGPQLIAALDGISPGGPPGAGPQSTSSSPAAGAPAPAPAAPAPAPAPTVVAAPPPAAQHPAAPAGSAPAGSAPAAAPSTTSTTAAPFITAVRSGATVDLTPVAANQVVRVTVAGTITDFQTNEPAYACLDGATLTFYDNLIGRPVAVAAAPANCITQDFLLPS